MKKHALKIFLSHLILYNYETKHVGQLCDHVNVIELLYLLNTWKITVPSSSAPADNVAWGENPTPPPSIRRQKAHQL